MIPREDISSGFANKCFGHTIKTRKIPAQAAFFSRDFGLNPSYPHFRHFTALGWFLAEHFMHINLLSVLASASGNLDIVIYLVA
jgi:hypothetical protein